MKKFWKWLFGTRKKQCNINDVSNSVCEYCDGWGYTEEGAIAVGCVCEDGKQTDC